MYSRTIYVEQANRVQTDVTPKSIKVNEFTKGRKDKAFYVTDFLIKITGAKVKQGDHQNDCLYLGKVLESLGSIEDGVIEQVG